MANGTTFLLFAAGLSQQKLNPLLVKFVRNSATRYSGHLVYSSVTFELVGRNSASWRLYCVLMAMPIEGRYS
jgi:hypothetical protein